MISSALWIPLISASIGAVFGLGGIVVGALLTQWREQKAQERKDNKDLVYLCALVSGELERFSTACEAVAVDDGERDEGNNLRPRTKLPEAAIDQMRPEWKSLPKDLMAAALDIPNRTHQAEVIVSETLRVAAMPPDFEEFFEQRQYQFAGLGIEALLLSRKLRAHAGIQATQQSPYFDPIETMEAVRSAIEAHWDGQVKMHADLVQRCQRPGDPQ